MAAQSIRAFISSFDGNDEVEKWVWEYLPNLSTNKNSRVRHEIFNELLFPVLKAGYLKNDFRCTLWLGKLIQNIYQTKKIHEELGWVTEINLFNKCYELDPGINEARFLLLKCTVSWLEYSEHEWPSGILYGIDGATSEQCVELSLAVQRVLELDKEHKYSEFIKQYNKKLTEYRARFPKVIQ